MRDGKERHRRRPAGVEPVRGIVAGVPLYPLLLGAAFVIAFPAASAIRPDAGGRALVVVLGASLLLVLLAVAVFPNPDRAGLAASLVLALAIAGTDPRLLVTVALVLVVIWIEGRVRRRERAAAGWTLISRIGLVFSAALVVILLVQATGNWLTGRRFNSKPTGTARCPSLAAYSQTSTSSWPMGWAGLMSSPRDMDSTRGRSWQGSRA